MYLTVAVLDVGAEMVTVGFVLYPQPPLVMVIPETTPVMLEAGMVAVAVVPDEGALMVTVGVVYPEPILVTEMDETV